MPADQPSGNRVTLAHLILLVPWVALVIDSLAPVRDNSYLWHITAGHLQRAAGSVINSDPLSFTMAGESWLTQSWLAELFYSIAEERFGLGFTGLMLLLAGLVFTVGVGVYVYDQSKSVPATAIIALLTATLFISFHVPRPVLFSYPLFVLLVMVWSRPALRWALPFLMWTWASAHASFAIGLVFLAVHVLWKREWRAWPHLLVAGSATLFTAHGLGVVTFLTDFATARPYLAYMSEWGTPNFLTPTLLPFLIGVVVLIFGSMKGRLRPDALWLIVPFLLIGVSASRSVATAWIGLLPVLALALRGTSWRFGRGFPVPIGVAVALLMLALPFLFAEASAIDEEVFPVAAMPHLVDVRTFHDDYAGGFLIYTEAFTEGVFLDDRAELYRERIREFVEVRADVTPWEEIFERDGIEQVLLNTDEPVLRRIQDAGWLTIYEDEFFVLLRP